MGNQKACRPFNIWNSPGERQPFLRRSGTAGGGIKRLKFRVYSEGKGRMCLNFGYEL